MKGIRKGLALVLVLCTLLSMVVMTGAGTSVVSDDAETLSDESATGSDFMRIFSLDCGRIYFSVSDIEAIIDQLAAYNYTHLQLAFGNGGLRFLLDDMSVTVDETTYASDEVKNAIMSGNTSYAAKDGHNGSKAANTCLSQSEMDTIIGYANGKGIQIIPLLNSPGHMNALVYAMGTLGITNAGYPISDTVSSVSTLNINYETAVVFTQNLIQKYINYFKGKDCTYFHMGADEFANDPSDTGKVGFTDTIKDDFIAYVNVIATKVSAAGMTPIMFNDGYAWSDANFNSDIVVSYWTSGKVRASAIADAGHEIINTSKNWYYVLGSPYEDGWCKYETALSGVEGTSVTTMIDSSSLSSAQLIGATMCFWCDYTDEVYTAEEASNVNTLIATLAVNNSNEFNNIVTFDVPVGGSNSVAVSGLDTSGKYSTNDSNVATVEVTEGVTTETATKATSVESGSKYVLVSAVSTNTTTKCIIASSTTGGPTGDQKTGMSLSAVTISGNNVTGYLENGVWTIESASNGTYYIKSSEGQYLNVPDTSSNSGGNVTLSDSAVSLTIGSNSEYTNSFSFSNSTGYLNNYGGAGTNNVAAAYGSNDGGSAWYLYKVTSDTTNSALTFTAADDARVGDTTYATVGNTRYVIHVVAEDVSGVTLTYHPWISNYAIYYNSADASLYTSEGTAHPMTIEASTTGVNTEDGVAIETLLPSTTEEASTGDWVYEGSGGIETYFWKGTILPAGRHQNDKNSSYFVDKNNTQTDMSMSGTDFTYIRYWGGNWQYSSDRENWTSIEDTDEVCVYYLMQTNVTTEVSTQVKDWAYTTGDASEHKGDNGHKALSFAVVYPDGTIATEDEICQNSTVIYYANLDDIGFIRVINNSNYTVSKITYTYGYRVNSNGTKYADSDTSAWLGTDRIVWEKKNDGTSLTKNGTYNEVTCWDKSYNTEPVVNGDNMITDPSDATQPDQGSLTNGYFNGSWGTNDAVLVLIYLESAVTEDSLVVHYMDSTSGTDQQFYQYGITVNEGTMFNENIGLNKESETSWKGNLLNGTVTNIDNKTQTVSADLATMPLIEAQYRYGDYTCYKVTLSDDQKEVYLYYTFNDTSSFVIDFGLPLTISKTDLNLDNAGGWETASVTDGTYGTATIENGSIVYKPTKVLTASDSILLKLTDSTGTSVRHIYIYPATTVYYEEGFATYAGTWTSEGSTGTGTQTASSALDTNAPDNDQYGYDDAYKNGDAYVGPSNGTEATTTATGNATATFSFTGTGVEIYANCTTNTGTAMVIIMNSKGDIAGLYSVDTKMAIGDTALTTGQNVTAYNVPIVSVTNLARDIYSVTVAYVKSGSETRSDGFKFDGFRVYDTLNSSYNTEDEATNSTAATAYHEDMEDNPTFTEVRNLTLAAIGMDNYSDGTYGSGTNVISQVYSDVSTTGASAVILASADTGTKRTYTNEELKDLVDNGPKNEIYLYSGQSLLLTVNTNREVQIGLKALNAATSYTINNQEKTLNASTDMFYPALTARTDGVKEQIITITNNGDGILAVTQLKICDDPDAIQPVSRESIAEALVQLGYVETADATLTVNVQCGDQTVPVTLTKSGATGETATFTAAEIEAAVKEALPEGYTVEDVTFSDMTVVYGESGSADYTAAAVQQPSAVQRVITAFVKLVRSIFSRWFR